MGYELRLLYAAPLPPALQKSSGGPPGQEKFPTVFIPAAEFFASGTIA